MTEQGRTFTESARRAQIVNAAIEVLAEAGYANASFAKIAKHAGLSSTGMISYHFKGKDDLMGEVITEVLRVANEYMWPRIDAAEGPSARMRTYIESNIELLSVYPKHLPAMIEVLRNITAASPHMTGFATAMDSILDIQVGLIEQAQRDGHFRQFDARVLAIAIRGAIDNVIGEASRNPGLDLSAYGKELADLFDHATRNVRGQQ